MIGRRNLITLIGGAAAWPLAARAQKRGNVPTIGFVQHHNVTAWTATFAQRLHELGWVEGRTVTIEYGWTEGRQERVAEIAAEFARRNVDVIVTYGSAVTTIKRMAASIPIVFAPAIDPVGSGLVASLSQPGGTVTGLSIQQAETAGKRLALLHEVVHGLRRLAILFDASYPAAAGEVDAVKRAALTLGIEVAPYGIKQAESFAALLGGLKGQTDALYVVENAFIAENGALIVQEALNARLPTSVTSEELVQSGALMSYGTKFAAMFRRVAEMVDKILHGTRPADIPIEQPTKFELVINLKTAKALGLPIPEKILALADTAIE